MKVFHIRKRSGSTRRIFAPSPEEKEKLRLCLPALNQKQEQSDTQDVQHGFRTGRSPVTNAMQHVGYTFTLSMDLADFFDSVSTTKVEWLYTVGFYFDCFLDESGDCGDSSKTRTMSERWAARQGLPTSPALANIAASKMDEDICALVGRRGRFTTEFVYTRYADDLTFSFNEERVASVLLYRVPEIVEKHGFKVNAAKTKLQCSKAGRRIITGVAVDDTLHPTREVKRRLRAMLHQGHKHQAQGLMEWALLKVPKAYAKREQIKRDAKREPAKQSVKPKPQGDERPRGRIIRLED